MGLHAATIEGYKRAKKLSLMKLCADRRVEYDRLIGDWIIVYCESYVTLCMCVQNHEFDPFMSDFVTKVHI